MKPVKKEETMFIGLTSLEVGCNKTIDQYDKHVEEVLRRESTKACIVSSIYLGIEHDKTAGQRYHYGMTLRDFFAGQALAGTAVRSDDWSNDQEIADWCYLIADEMLKAREEQNAN